MAASTWLDEEFEHHRSYLTAVAYRMLGSSAEADDAVQDTWLRAHGAGADDVENLRAWLTTVLARVCLNMLRTRSRRREEPLEFHVPDPVIACETGDEPESAAVLADSVGVALLVVLDTLAPAERLAFVLHDLFDLPYEQIAGLVDRTPEAARQLASRARRRVRGGSTDDRDSGGRQRAVVDAFLAAARGGDLGALVEVLDPDVTLRIDAGDRPALSTALRGVAAVAAQTTRGLATALNRADLELHPVVLNGGPGIVATTHGRPFSLIGFVVADGRIVAIDAIADPDRIPAITAGWRSGR